MDAPTLRRVLTAFADTPADVSLEKGRLLAQVREELVEASLELRTGEIFVRENGDVSPAALWVANRIARLPLLAERIRSFVPDEQCFVTPRGSVLDSIEDAPTEAPQAADDAVVELQRLLGKQPAFTSTVVYLTSDAGEGKTTVINELARRQAEAFKRKETHWLVVPVPLAGRHFLRLDDVVVGALTNKLRFPFWYYDAFLELVRLGFLVPALDGFEEMFVETSSGEAVSALGSLMQLLQSSGSILVAARKAYFEYRSLQTQARLFDALGKESVTFCKVSLEKWGQAEFEDYALQRGVVDSPGLYRSLSEELGSTHPLLTRAVLVRRLVEVASAAAERQELFDALRGAPGDYFEQFVHSIISREAREKWIDRSGDPAKPLLDEKSHYDILSAVAREMWMSQTEILGWEIVELVAQMECEAKRVSAVVASQVVERVKQHALLVQHQGSRSAVGFDHQEFYHYFLGWGLARALQAGALPEIRQLLQRGAIPELSLQVVAGRLKHDNSGKARIAELLSEISETEMAVSVVRENAGALFVELADAASGPLRGRFLVLGREALRNRRFTGVLVEDSRLHATSVGSGGMEDVVLRRCEIEELAFERGRPLEGLELGECRVRAVRPRGGEEVVFEPTAINRWLLAAGAKVEGRESTAAYDVVPDIDEELSLTERAVRKFVRATELNELVFKQKLGERAAYFLDHVVPTLLREGVLREVDYRGAGKQRRFRLGAPLSKIEVALERARGSFRTFIEEMR